MARLRGVAWGALLTGLALYMGRIWFGDLRHQLGTLAGAGLSLVRGTSSGFAVALHPAGEAGVTLAAIAVVAAGSTAMVRRGWLGGLTLGGGLAPASSARHAGSP